MIATTITACVALRKQIIDDIYQITGMADIMRGDTDPNETLGAQQMKAQYGTTRIRDKQQELARVARDLVEITSEIITKEKFKGDTIIEMSQDAITDQGDGRAAGEAGDPAADPSAWKAGARRRSNNRRHSNKHRPQPGQQDPQTDQHQQLQQAVQAGIEQLKKLQAQPTIDQVLKLLKDNRGQVVRARHRNRQHDYGRRDGREGRAALSSCRCLSNLLPQLSQMITAEPKTAAFCGEMLKFATAPFRAGRTLDGAIDDLVEQMKAKGEQQGKRATTPTHGDGQDPAADRDPDEGCGSTAQQNNAQDLQVAQAKLQQDDQHHQALMTNQRLIAADETATPSGQATNRSTCPGAKPEDAGEQRERTRRS